MKVRKLRNWTSGDPTPSAERKILRTVRKASDGPSDNFVTPSSAAWRKTPWHCPISRQVVVAKACSAVGQARPSAAHPKGGCDPPMDTRFARRTSPVERQNGNSDKSRHLGRYR